MILFALDPWWNDFYAAGGFWIGAISGVVGLAGLWYAIRQVWKVKTAAEAAEAAAIETLTRSKDAYVRFVGAFARRLLDSLDNAVRNKEWNLAYQLREFGQKFAAAAPKYRNEKWNRLILDLHALLDNVTAPFRNDSNGQTGPTPRGTETPGDRTDSPPEVEGGPGELGSRGPVAE